MRSLAETLVWIRGAGDLASGVAYRLTRSGFPVVMTELARPLVVRRTVAFATAVAAGRCTVEGLTAVLAADAGAARAALARGELPVLVDPEGRLARQMQPRVAVDAIMAKRNLGTRIDDAPVVVALGPGFVAGTDVHAVVETERGHNLGRVIHAGPAAPDTGVPGVMHGVDRDRVLRAPVTGRFVERCRIGDLVKPGDLLAEVEPDGGGPALPVRAAIGGVVRGLLATGVSARAGMKVGDVDPSGDVSRCQTISDKALAIGGGVLEAVLYLLRRRGG